MDINRLKELSGMSKAVGKRDADILMENKKPEYINVTEEIDVKELIMEYVRTLPEVVDKLVKFEDYKEIVYSLAESHPDMTELDSPTKKWIEDEMSKILEKSVGSSGAMVSEQDENGLAEKEEDLPTTPLQRLKIIADEMHLKEYYIIRQKKSKNMLSERSKVGSPVWIVEADPVSMPRVLTTLDEAKNVRASVLLHTKDSPEIVKYTQTG